MSVASGQKQILSANLNPEQNDSKKINEKNHNLDPSRKKGISNIEIDENRFELQYESIAQIEFRGEQQNKSENEKKRE